MHSTTKYDDDDDDAELFVIFVPIGIIFSFILLLAYCIAATQVSVAAVFTFTQNVRNALNFSVLRC